MNPPNFQPAWVAFAILSVCHGGEIRGEELAVAKRSADQVLQLDRAPNDSSFVGPPAPAQEMVLKAEPVFIPHEEFVPSVYDAVANGDESLLHHLLESGLPATSLTRENDTPLCAALRLGRTDLAIELLLYGADPNVKGLLNETPTALAALRRHPLLLRMLLASGANPNAALGDELTPTALNLVSDPGVRREVAREGRLTPLMISSARGDVESVALLLAYGASTEAHSMPHRRYALEFAADRNYLYVMRLLLGRKPESEPHVLITVNLTRQRAKLQIDGETKLSTTISTGREGYETPAGRYVITNKYKEWTSTLYKVAMPNFLRLNCSSIGLHAGYVTGSPASHGCIRLPSEMSSKFYKLTKVGDEVIIEY